MATVLTKAVARMVVGLKRDDKDVTVVLEPRTGGADLSFRLKSSRKAVSVPLKDCMDLAFGDVCIMEGKGTAAKMRPTGTKGEADTVDLASLETRIMMDGEDMMTPAVKGRLWSIVREIREERRDEMGLDPVRNGPTKKMDAENED